MSAHDHEQVIAFQNRAVGLRGILAIHDTTCGPALGGVRIWRYASEADALTDALRLSRGMTYKAAISELPCGGGKTVILLRDDLQRAEAFEAFGQLVESLRGRYFTARDVGITDDGLQAIARTTKYVAKEPDPALGDVSEHTAIGVWHGLRACLEFAGIAGKGSRVRVAMQGVGSVGLHLARILKSEGMELVVADVNAARANQAAAELGGRMLPPDEILFADCDVLAPCALGGVFSLETIPRVQAGIICGCANNQLATPEAGDELARRGIVYAPDYLVNAGGLIRGAEYFLLGRADSLPSLAGIHNRMMRVLQLAQERRVSAARIADELAEARLKQAKTYRDLHWGGSPPAASRPKT
ncbi:MAG: Glu/Leu/Phe/Val dehydrogenase [Acidobacteria bacterium]|nr:Glu/Leu/Phe/Val dehydrogenase [Acidobacteriota bacterium]